MKDPIFKQPWRETRFVVVDLETTGLDPAHHEIIAFASIPIQDGRVIPGGLVSTLVRPAHPPKPDSIRIHGLRTADLYDQQSLEEHLDLIAETLSGAVMVAHCAWIETRFLETALARAGAGLTGPVIDTMALGRAVLDSTHTNCPPNPPLGFLARSLNLPVHRPHHADGDALTTAQVFLALATKASRHCEATVGDLLQSDAGWGRLRAIARRAGRNSTAADL